MAKENKAAPPKPVEPTVRAVPNIQPLMYQHTDGRVYLKDKSNGKKTLMHMKPAQSMVRSNPSRYEIIP